MSPPRYSGSPEKWRYTIISHKVFFKSFCNSQFPQKIINVSFMVTNKNDELTDLFRNWLLQNDFKNTSCEIKLCKAQPLIELTPACIAVSLESTSVSFLAEHLTLPG